MECRKKITLITTALIGLGAAAVTTQVLADTVNTTPELSTYDATKGMVKIGGFLQTDFFNFTNDSFGDGADIRRADLFARVRLDNDWSSQIAINLAGYDNIIAGNCPNVGVNACATGFSPLRILDDSWVAYSGFSPFWFAVGRITSPFGLDATTSAASSVFMERASVASMFAPPSGVGLYLEGTSDYASFQASAYAPDHNTERGYTYNDPWGYTARVVFNPARDPGYVFHVGASYNYEDYKNTEQFGRRYTAGPEMYSRQQTRLGISSIGALSTVIGDNVMKADYTQAYGGELAGAWGPFTAQGEYQHTHVTGLSGVNDLNWSGWYAQLAWVITCETKPYDPVYAVFGNPIPSRNYGAWEVAARYSDLNLSDTNSDSSGWIASDQRGKMNDWTLGVNWYATQNVKVQANWVHSQNDYNTGLPNESISAWGIRAQVVF